MYAIESATMDEQEETGQGFYIYPIKSNGNDYAVYALRVSISRSRSWEAS